MARTVQVREDTRRSQEGKRRVEDRDGDWDRWDLGMGRQGLMGGDAEASCLPGASRAVPWAREHRGQVLPWLL